MRTLLALPALGLLLWSGCSPTPVNSGSSTVDAATSDAASDGVAAADAATAVDAVAEVAAADAVPGDSSGGDSQDGTADSVSVDVIDGGGDIPSPDAQAPDSKDGGADATTGPYTCETACASIAKAQCPADPTLVECVGECGQFIGQAPPACVAVVQELLKCVSTATVTCKDGGKSDSNVCNYMEGELAKCFGDGPPPNPDPCPAGNCYGGAGPNGEESCGCDTTCYGTQIKLDCAASKCSCTINGKVTNSFDQGSVCSANPWLALQSACGLPTGP